MSNKFYININYYCNAECDTEEGLLIPQNFFHFKCNDYKPKLL